MVDRDDRTGTGPATKPRKWLPLAIGAAVLLLLLIFGLRACSDGGDTGASNGAVLGAGNESGVTASDANMGTAASAGVDDGSFTVEGLRGYLQDTSATTAGERSFGLDRVTFDTGSAQLDQQDLAVVGEVAGVLKQFPNAAVTITGYADPAGDATANKKLAAQRAVAVKQSLAGQGLAADKLMTNVVGETGAAAVQENRRVELLVRR
jgi:outer membrane protein OmpA-like peptidoglycan-associated protein